VIISAHPYWRQASAATATSPGSLLAQNVDKRTGAALLSETLPITHDIDEAHASVAAFLDPVFVARDDERWWNQTSRIWIARDGGGPPGNGARRTRDDKGKGRGVSLGVLVL
jgi:hypothetical protein